MPPPVTLALDIGGANLKACDGRAAWSQPFALWREPHRLPEALVELARPCAQPARVVYTMTGELCDCFPSRAAGVRCIVDACRHAFPRAQRQVWTADGAWLAEAQACEQPLRVAAGNWRALAQWVAMTWPEGRTILIDIGSTTTDVLRLEQGRVVTDSLTDPDRLDSGELAYLGGARTALMALHGEGPWMNEAFARMDDVALWLGFVSEDAADRDTCDGQPRTLEAAGLRLARMAGHDRTTMTDDGITALARRYLSQAVARVAESVARVSDGKPVDRLVFSGSAAWLGELAADHLAARWTDAPPARVHLAQVIGDEASAAACAWALAQLARTEDGTPVEAPAGSVPPPVRVVKLGGSLLDLPDLVERLSAWRGMQAGAARELWIVGGGRAADLVRDWNARFALDDEQGHWLAVRAMQLNARLLAASLPGTAMARTAHQARRVWSDGKAAVVAPLAWLEHAEQLGRGAPHRWTFTSDSIAAHACGLVGADWLTLLKSTAQPDAATTADAARLGLVDKDFPAASAGLGRVELINLRATSWAPHGLAARPPACVQPTG